MKHKHVRQVKIKWFHLKPPNLNKMWLLTCASRGKGIQWAAGRRSSNWAGAGRAALVEISCKNTDCWALGHKPLLSNRAKNSEKK